MKSFRIPSREKILEALSATADNRVKIEGNAAIVTSSDNTRTQAYWENRPEVFQMLYEDFINEYEECMKIAKEKEAKGHLDPYNPNYVPMTEEEVKLHESDWRAFSRQRGYSEYDIAEYARWLKLSGQADNLEYAINDPWRRMYPNWGEQLYIKHIEIAISLGIEISPEVKASYEMVKKELERPIRVIGRSASHFDEITDGDTPKKR